jgi:hypothetical protein
MAATSKTLKQDHNGNPIPQWYDPLADDYAAAPGDATDGGYVQVRGGVTLADRSVTGTGAAVTAIAANAARTYLLIKADDENASDAWVSLVGTAADGGTSSMRVPAAGGFEWNAAGRVPRNALSVLVETGDTLLIWEG